jgi:ATP-dependent Clp protease ATP-binding subunit ClpC
MSDKLDRFTPEARHALTLAKDEAVRLKQDFVGPEHLLVALVNPGNGPVVEVLRELEIQPRLVVETVEKSMVEREMRPTSNPVLSSPTKRAIELMVEEARQLGHRNIGVEHLLCGVVQVDESAMLNVWRALHIDPQRVRRQMQRRLLLKGEPVRARATESYFKAPNLTTDLIAAAAQGKLDLLFRRAQELDRLVQMLCRRTKRNVLLVGEPGVGRRTLVYGLAQRMNDGVMPVGLLGRSLQRLDLDPDGAADRGIWRHTLASTLTETLDACVASDALLFVDKLHKYIRPDEANAETATRLKLAVNRANLQLIATTTPDQYEEFIGPDRERDWLLQVLRLDEPSLDETLEILRGVKPLYEQHHHVVMTEQALQAAVHLAAAHVPERFLPEKAIALVDEAGSHVQMHVVDELRSTFLALKQVRQQQQAALKAEEIDEAVRLRVREVELAAQLDEQRSTARLSGPRPEVTREDVAQVVAQWTGLPTSQLLSQEGHPAQDAEPPDEAAEQ